MRGDISGVKYKSGRFWGVTRQQGPWETTPMDRKREDGVQVRKAGGGIGIGINDSTTNANSWKVINPYTVDATKAPSTKYFQQTIVYKKDYRKGSQVLGKKKLPSEEVGLMKQILDPLEKKPDTAYPSYDKSVPDTPGDQKTDSGVDGVSSPSIASDYSSDDEDGELERRIDENIKKEREEKRTEYYNDTEAETQIMRKRLEELRVPGAYPQEEIVNLSPTPTLYLEPDRVYRPGKRYDRERDPLPGRTTTRSRNPPGTHDARRRSSGMVQGPRPEMEAIKTFGVVEGDKKGGKRKADSFGYYKNKKSKPNPQYDGVGIQPRGPREGFGLDGWQPDVPGTPWNDAVNRGISEARRRQPGYVPPSTARRDNELARVDDLTKKHRERSKYVVEKRKKELLKVAKKVKRPPPIDTTNVPPSRQRNYRNTRAENNSTEKKNDKLPSPKTRGGKKRADRK